MKERPYKIDNLKSTSILNIFDNPKDFDDFMSDPKIVEIIKYFGGRDIIRYNTCFFIYIIDRFIATL